MTAPNFHSLFQQVPASKASKRLVADYIRSNPSLQRGLAKAPPCALSWWGLLRQAEIAAGLRRPSPTIRVSWN